MMPINVTTTTRPLHSTLTVLVLVIGDLHIPIRSHDLPFKFRKLLVPGKIQQVLLTGNVCDGETLEWLRGICNGDVRATRGDWDDVRGSHLSVRSLTMLMHCRYGP